MTKKEIAKAELMIPVPVRIQRKRAKGYNMQDHSYSINGLDCVYVGRPTKWGNPYRVGNICQHPLSGKPIKVSSKNQAAGLFELKMGVASDFVIEEIKEELAGKNLSCWCKEGSSCHADILLAICNNSEGFG